MKQRLGFPRFVFAAAWLASVVIGSFAPARAAERLKLLFLGDQGHHTPARRFQDLAPVLARRGMDLTYTEDLTELNPARLAQFDGLVIYANQTAISSEQEKALIEYVEGGKGLIPLHCASYCFLNSPRYVDLVGAQFLRHSTGVFRTEIVEPENPVMKGFKGFESWDETYVHTHHNEKDRVVLERRVDVEGKEPWTWTRTQGKGRVFYTAWGHDQRTWTHPGFQNLVERGILWAVGRDPSIVPAYTDRPEMTKLHTDVKPFEFREARIPFYPAGRQWGTTAEPIARMQLPLDPEESMKHMVTPDAFEVRLFASDPDIRKPICMIWDEKSRLWISETIDYPNELRPADEGRDQIKICEDTDGDGKADRFSVFADKLSIPTAMAFHKGGLIAFSMPRTLYLKDTDGDGKADERKVLFSGWGVGDTHATASNLRYGFDNWLHGIVGYSGFEGTIGGERQSFRQGFFRFVPDGSRLEFLRNTNNNSWGVGFSEEGVLFGSTANRNPSEYLPIPNRYYEAVRGWSSTVLNGIADSWQFTPITDKVRQVDQHGGFTAAAGHALYTAREYPREYWNRAAFVAEPTGHLISTFIIRQEGAGYVSHNSWNLLASDDEWCAPILAEVGPDGYVWVIDWYNIIVQHNPTPAGFRTGRGNAYEIDLRDKSHGRVYRLVPRGAAPRPLPRLDASKPDALVAALKSDNMFWRLQAQRLLVERGEKDIVPLLLHLASDPSVDEIGLNPGAIHALWTLHGLGALDGSNEAATAAAVAALRHRSAGVRRNAAQVLPRTSSALAALLASGTLRDADGQVRLEAFLALADMPSDSNAGAAIAESLSDATIGNDRWLLDAVTCAAARHDVSFLATVVQKGALAKAPTALERVAIVAEHYGRAAPVESVELTLRTLATAGGPAAGAVLAGLAKGWPGDRPPRLTDGIEESLEALFEKLEPSDRGRLVSLAARWGSQRLEKHAAEIAAGFLAEVGDEAKEDSARIAAARQLVTFRRDARSVESLLERISVRSSPELVRGFLEAASACDASEAGDKILGAWERLTPATRPAAIRALLSREEWTASLLDALEAGTIQSTELLLDQKQGLAAHPRRRIAQRAQRLLAKGEGLPDPDRQKVLDELLPSAKSHGDAALGKEVYKKICSKCHVHGDEGTRIGPDLTGMAVHPKEELLTNIIDPSRSVEGNYRVYTVVTKDGRVMTGLLASETRTSVELFDSEGKKETVQRADIDQLVAGTKSLMPEGFEKQISKEELVNLLEFLAQRGKYLPIPIAKAATVSSNRGMFFSEDARAERLVFPDWTPKTFEGVPFVLVDPQDGRVPNAILLYGPNGNIPPRMPKSVRLPCNSPAKAIHMLSGVSGWGYPASEKGTVSLIVRLHFEDGSTEDHALKNGEEFADYIRRVDVPGSKFAFALRGQQIRYLAVVPTGKGTVKDLELVKGPDSTAPVVMAVTVETGS